MRIDVTAEDIANGSREQCLWCPIALAVFRATGKRYEVTHGAVISHLPFLKVVPLPPEARSFINQFDVHGAYAVRPFSFELPLP